ncbi:MAG: hypothetical protein AB1751_04745 [Acidobacteriota bacterium]
MSCSLVAPRGAAGKKFTPPGVTPIIDEVQKSFDAPPDAYDNLSPVFGLQWRHRDQPYEHQGKYYVGKKSPTFYLVHKSPPFFRPRSRAQGGVVVLIGKKRAKFFEKREIEEGKRVKTQAKMNQKFKWSKFDRQ